MKKPGKLGTKHSPVRQPVLLGLFAGTAVGAGYLLAGIPNVELMSLVIALSGAVLGPVAGPLCGVLSGTIYSLGNPYGPPPPVLLAAQMLGHGLTGFLGWFFGRQILQAGKKAGFIRISLLAATSGFAGTFFYQVFTNLAIVLMAPDADPRIILAGMIYFALVHIGVNTILFFLFFPHLVRRLAQAGQSPLVGRSIGVLFFGLLVSGIFTFDEARAQQALPDSMVMAPGDTLSHAEVDSLTLPDAVSLPVPGPHGWKRPLWNPFSATTIQWLNNRTNWVPVTDGGLGGMTVILGEANTSVSPMFLRDGIPQGTGHRLADDPWLVSNQAVVLVQQKTGRDWSGGTDGVVNMATDEKDLAKAVSFYRGIKGPHETYMRGISLMTPKTAWRLGFEFDENIDRDGYNYSDQPDEDFNLNNEFRGHSSIRRSRTRLIRHLDDDNSLTLEYSTARKTKDDLPTIGAEHQEIWSDGASATVRSRTGDWALRTAIFWNSRTVEWGDRPVGTVPGINLRKLEAGREGVVLDLIHSPRDTSDLISPFQPDAGLRQESLNGPASGLRLMVNHWDIHDDGVDWDLLPASASSADGTEARLAARTGLALGSSRLNFGLFGDYQDYAGLWPGGFVAFQQAQINPWWKMVVEAGGRAPRSDELLTPLLHVVDTQELYLLPNVDLTHEKTLRANLLFNTSVLGFDLALDLSARQLRDGITWIADPAEAFVGHWRNQLDMDSQRLTASIARQGRFLGWGRARVEGTWQEFDEKTAKAAFLPPNQYLRMELMWELHLFKEDGILQAALLSTYRGPMGDPWDVTRTVTLPSATTHDLLVGFRLVGTHLSLNFRNVTDQRIRLSSATLSPGREIDLRLNWVFLY